MPWIFDDNSYFVDSAQSDDTGDGLTEATAKKTLSAAIGLSPSAGSTIFLSGGTHTVTAATTLALPSKVNLIGGGPRTTYLTGDTESAEPYLVVNGSNVLEGINLTSTGADSSNAIGTSASNGASDLTLKNCELSGVGTPLAIAKPTSGVTKVLLEDCSIDSADASGIQQLGNVDLEIRRCKFAGDNDAVDVSPAVAGDISNCHAHDSTFDMTSSADAFSLTSTTTAAVNAMAHGCTFSLGTGEIVRGNGSSTGVPAFIDAGGNNIADGDVDLTGAATFTRSYPAATDILTSSDVPTTTQINTAIEAGQVGIDADILNDLKALLRFGSAQSGTGTTIVLAAAEAVVDDSLIGSLITVYQGVGGGQTRRITDYVFSTRTVTVDSAWVTGAEPTSGSNYVIWPADPTLSTDASGANTNSQVLVNEMPWEVLCTGTNDGEWTAGSFGNFVTWSTGAPTNDTQYQYHLIVFADGQTRWLTAIDFDDPDITVDRAFTITIPTGTAFKIYNVIHPHLEDIEANVDGSEIRANTLQAGGTTTVTLDASADATDDHYNGCMIKIANGFNDSMTRFIEDYDGTTKVATLDIPLAADPGAVSFTIYNTRSSTTQIRPSDSKRIAGEGTTAKNLDQVSGGVVGGGGAPVHGRMDYVGFLDNRVLDVIQGEEQRLTVVLETDGTFPLPVTTLTIVASDSTGSTVTINDADISRVIEDSQVYVMRFTLPAADTATLAAGLLNLEVTLDNEKSQILSAIEIIATLE